MEENIKNPETQTDKQKQEKLVEFMKEVKKKDYPRTRLISVLHYAQDLYGYIKRETIDLVSQHMDIPTSHIWGVATFYHYFNLTPPGKFKISVCMGTACFVKGADMIIEHLKQETGIDMGETSKDGLFSLAETRCLGACALAPVIMINETIYGKLDKDKVSDLIKKCKKESKKEEVISE